MSSTTLAPLLAKLRARSRLDDDDAAALLALPHTLKTLPADSYLVREGDRAHFTCVLLSGFAYRQKIVADGGRQIIGLQVPGDLVDLHNSMLGVADHGVQTLTEATVALIPRAAIIAITLASPAIAHALWIDTLVDGAIAREWIANIGRRSARARIAHMLCEFAIRLTVAGVEQGESYELPMSQEQIGDALGLTAVHVNRMIRDLEKEGLIARSKRKVTILQAVRLRTVAGFTDTYLHLNLPEDARRRD